MSLMHWLSSANHIRNKKEMSIFLVMDHAFEKRRLGIASLCSCLRSPASGPDRQPRFFFFSLLILHSQLGGMTVHRDPGSLTTSSGMLLRRRKFLVTGEVCPRTRSIRHYRLYAKSVKEISRSRPNEIVNNLKNKNKKKTPSQRDKSSRTRVCAASYAATNHSTQNIIKKQNKENKT